MIRWIRENLGTAPYQELGEGDWSVLDIRYIVDKAGNSPALIGDIVRQGATAVRAGKKVVVACDFGISRSNAVAAGILSVTEGRVFDWALQEVITHTGEKEIKLDLVEAVRNALEGHNHRADRHNVLVTGAAGFLGRHLVAGFQAPFKAFAPSRAELDLEAGAVALAEYCTRQSIGQIVHLAYPHLYTNPSALGSSLIMLRAVLEACRALDARLIFVSCWIVFGGQAGARLLLEETAPMIPKGPYGEGKYLEEMLVDLYFKRGEIDRSICRLTPVYGSGGDRPRFIRTFHDLCVRGDVVRTHIFRNGRPALDLLHVTDAVDALRRVIESEASDIFHFGTGEFRTTAELAALIAGTVGRPLMHEEVLIEDDTSNVAFPAAKARAILGWSPTISIEAGLAALLSPSVRSKAL